MEFFTGVMYVVYDDREFPAIRFYEAENEGECHVHATGECQYMGRRRATGNRWQGLLVRPEYKAQMAKFN